MPVFPQPRFSQKENVSMMGNPALFKVKKGNFEATIGVCSDDVLSDISRSEISKGTGGPRDRFHDLASHLIRQKTFYPLFPPPIDSNFNIEWSDSDFFAMAEVPNILILPSQLNPFVKVVDGVVCINPGFMMRGDSSGTYAEISVNCIDGLPFSSCCRVDVVHL